MGIIQGYTAKPDDIHSTINVGRELDDQLVLDPEVFNLSVTGARLLVVRDEAESSVGGIVIPETVRLKNPPGSGWVVSVGPAVGIAGTSQYPFGLDCDHPTDLLCKRIIFGMYSGSEFLTGIREGGFTTRFWIITARDIWMVDDQ